MQMQKPSQTKQQQQSKPNHHYQNKCKGMHSCNPKAEKQEAGVCLGLADHTSKSLGELVSTRFTEGSCLNKVEGD